MSAQGCRGCGVVRGVSGSGYCRICEDTYTVSDAQIRSASLPDAAALLRRAKQQGLIAPMQGYGPAPDAS